MNKVNNQFEIRILNQHWVAQEEKYKPNDLCSHGGIYLRIGDKVLSNDKGDVWTTSSTGLYLMKTLFSDYRVGDFSSQLIPCCGHLFMANEDFDRVEILGCGNGIDWNIKHIGNTQINHTTLDGLAVTIDKKEYSKIVCEFVNQVEKFYANSAPKILPEDEFDRKGYEAFWREWKLLKKKIE